MTMRCIGIDPGLLGGLGVLELVDGQLGRARLARTPVALVTVGGRTRRRYDVPSMWRDLCIAVGGDPHDGALVALETVSTRPGQHAAATLQTGIGFGTWHALCVARGVPVVLVTPQAWKRFHGLLHANKRASRLRAAERFPALAPIRAADEGPAEALLLAAYAAATQLPGRDIPCATSAPSPPSASASPAASATRSAWPPCRATPPSRAG